MKYKVRIDTHKYIIRNYRRKKWELLTLNPLSFTGGGSTSCITSRFTRPINESFMKIHTSPIQ